MRPEHPSIRRLPPLHGRRVQPQLRRRTGFPGTRQLATTYSLRESATVQTASAGTRMTRKSSLRPRPNVWPDGRPDRKRRSATSLFWTVSFRSKMELMTQRDTQTVPGNQSTSTSTPWRMQPPILNTRITVPARTLTQASRTGPALQRILNSEQPLQLFPPTTLTTRTNLKFRQLPASTYN